jgi:hypothetical protein
MRTDKMFVGPGNNPSLTQLYAEIGARASREAIPEPTQGGSAERTIMHQEMAQEVVVRDEMGNTEAAGLMAVQRSTSMDIVQVRRSGIGRLSFRCIVNSQDDCDEISPLREPTRRMDEVPTRWRSTAGSLGQDLDHPVRQNLP